MQYLSSRYSKGKDSAQDFMEKRHATVCHKSVNLAHGDIVEKQASLGPAAYLGLSHHVKNMSMRNKKLRLTVMVLDNTLWPTRILA